MLEEMDIACNTCAPDTGPKGLGGLMTGWLYIKVGCVITGTLPI
jgi:hypothetical protein